MRNIPIDEDVWKELQRRAEPLVDDVNSVLRKILLVSSNDTEFKEREIRIQLTSESIHSARTYSVIPIPRAKRRFFPGYKVDFYLELDDITITTRVTSAPKGTLQGDPYGGAYMQGNLKSWYLRHPEIKDGSVLLIESLDPGKKYKLSIEH